MVRAFHTPRLSADQRIGPHHFHVLSFFYGALLGDGYAEKHGAGVRVQFHQRKRHVAYLMHLHSYLASFGYVNPDKPRLSRYIGKNGKIYYRLKFRTWTFSRLAFLHNAWYKDGVKVLPKDLEFYLTPLSLAVWIRDDGHYTGCGTLLCTDNFTKKEVEQLSIILMRKFGLQTTLRLVKKKYWCLYIPAKSMALLKKLTKEFIDISMHRKLGNIVKRL